MERPDSWFEPEDDYENECDKCEKLKDRLTWAAHFVEAVLDMAYSKEEMNLDLFERCLDEACHYLDLRLPEGDIQIQRKQ